ncbi:MAG TPA: cation-translocating P-type ATPase [Polyangiaceae bacterium]|nr:cation-translocating P-type ATPase [Polyangiaceae bacterium]
MRRRADLAPNRPRQNRRFGVLATAQNLQIHALVKGLTAEQARAALQRHGENRLPQQKPKSLLARLGQQFQSALIYVLLVALLVDVAAWLAAGSESVPLEALAIFGVLLLNAGLGVLQEYRSEQALAELQKLGAPRVWVLRDDSFERVDAATLVPDDVVRLEAGDRVPADGVAGESEGLSVDESVLTGESLPIEKHDGDEVQSGSLVTHGRSLLLVRRTGSSSAMGKLALSLDAIDVSKTPLERRVDDLGRQIAKMVGAICLGLVLFGIATDGFDHLLSVVMFGVAFGVAVVPEGMPAMMTLSLALGVQRMARRQAVVRRLTAVEALGSVTVIATDKTGTLTQNRLSVAELRSTQGHDEDALSAMVLANDADYESGAGDPLELALVAFAREQGTDVPALQRAYPRLSSRGFDSQWRCMRATVLSPQGQQIALLKGAIEAVIARCRLSDVERLEWLERAERAAQKGFKVLGLAKGTATAEHELKFLGMVSLWDAPRPEAKAAVRAAQRAGIRVLMLTGDHPTTASAVAAAVGIPSPQPLLGDELLKLSDSELDLRLTETNVFARMQPEHKLRLIERLQAKGEVVAMTGDGLNDAPALKRADVGVAMAERGSDVAREVADLVLLDDNFATIVVAIEEGRSIYRNIQSFIRFSFSSNVALMLLVLGGAVGSLGLGLRTQDGGLLLPLTALQILWINFLGDGPPALALALDSSKNAMLEAPRSPKASLLEPLAARFVIADGVLKAGFGLALLVLLPRLGASAIATASAVFLYEGIAKVTSVFPARRLAGGLHHNGWVYGATAVSIALQLACVGVPALRELLDLSPLRATHLGIVAGALLATLVASELIVRVLRGREARYRDSETFGVSSHA